ncbi:MAG: IS91 family transposase [Betaproteobacteria bacterium]
MQADRPAIYRPRRPHASPLWQCVRRHLPELRACGRVRRAVEKNVLERFLDCGDPHRGFARIRCAGCGHDLLLAFSCKTRYFCPSCHQKRVLAWGDWVEQFVLRPVAHRQYVFTVPKLIRPFFAYRRSLLGELCRIVARSLTEAYRVAYPRGCPGFILFVQTFGDLVNFNPHVHALVADGVFEPSGRFLPLPPVPEALLAERLRRDVLGLLVRREAIPAPLAAQMLNWRHSGFSVHNRVRVAAGDAEGRKSLAGYMLRAPFSLEKMSYDAARGAVIYRSGLHATLKRNFQAMPGVQWLELLCKHIPDRNEHMVRYYGRYSSRTRGAEREPPELEASDTEVQSPARQAAKAAWAKLIRKVYEVDPLECPKCGAQMRVIALIEDPAVIERILTWLGLWEPRQPGGPSPPTDPPSLPFSYHPVPDIA